MNARRLALVLALLASGLFLAEAAQADRGRHPHSRARIGVFIGAPLFWPWYYPPYHPWYPYPSQPVVVVPATPPTYIERGEEDGAEAAPAPPGGYWYYCYDPPGYYPDVRQCRGGWQAVPPRPQ